MYRATARRVCRCHEMDRDEAQQPPPTCWLPHLATRRVSAGCAPSGLALHLLEHQGCRRCAQVFGDDDPGVQDRLPHERGQTRLSASMLSIRPNVCANRNWVMVGEMPVERSAQLILLLYLDKRVHLRYGSTADQGRTGREDSSSPLWRPARAPGTHAKRGPSTGHSAVGLRQAGKVSPDAEATFHCAIMHAW